jgi:RNA polymerase sigma factor (sigma-70 family)
MPVRAQPTDEELIARTAAKDQLAFRMLVDRHKTFGMTLATRILQDTMLAEEALQDAFVRVYRSASTFRGNAKFTTWFYKILHNVSISMLGSIDKNVQALEEAALPHVLESYNETGAIFEDLLNSLPERYRTVSTLYYLQEFSYDEIAEICALPLGTVKTVLHRSRELLKKSKELQEHLGVTPVAARQ